MKDIEAQLATLDCTMGSIKAQGSKDPLIWIRSEFVGKLALMLLKMLRDHLEWHRKNGDD